MIYQKKVLLKLFYKVLRKKCMGINNLFKYGYTVFNNVVSDEIVKDFNKTFPSVPVFSKTEYSFDGQIRGDINYSNEETRDVRETLDKFKIILFFTDAKLFKEIQVKKKQKVKIFIISIVLFYQHD